MNENLFDKLCKLDTLLHAWKLVKQKGTSGGIDGMTIDDIDADIGNVIREVQHELLSKKWNPEPYLRISIPKKNNEKRQLGLLSIKDKIVQQAIKILIEPKFEKIFVSNSYGYRPDKGHTRAIKFARYCLHNKKYPFVLKLDIDNYFDTINHEILFKRVQAVVPDMEIVRLIQWCIKMGVVDKKMKWNEITEGVAQGAVLSPILANFYLHSFDQYILTRTKMYVRYADDFLICCTSREEAETLQKEASEFLENRLKLRLNEPRIYETNVGVEFLGITITNKELSLSASKQEGLHQRIQELKWTENGFDGKSLKKLTGVKNYYATLLPEKYLEGFDDTLISRLKEIITQDWKKIPNKTTLTNALKCIDFYSNANLLMKSQIRGNLINLYLNLKNASVNADNEQLNKTLVKQRKREYKKLETDGAELVITQYGTSIGVSYGKLSLKVYGKQQKMPPMSNLKHISVLCNGVSISSNAIAYCMQNKISIDFFPGNGQHTASILSTTMTKINLWEKQVEMSLEQKAKLAGKIIYGKLKNQLNLIKYFHKYHKKTSEKLCAVYDSVEPKLKSLLSSLSKYEPTENYRPEIMGIEAAGAAAYWNYISELIADDDVGFQSRERKGATDLVNSMLNYGYSILYARVWRSLLYRQLNPSFGILHEPNQAKPTFVFDVIELFRAQAVDRVVISLVQKGEGLKIKNGLLSDETKKLLMQNLIERMHRYENYRDKESRLCDIINFQTKEIAEYIENGKTFRPYIAKW